MGEVAVVLNTLEGELTAEGGAGTGQQVVEDVVVPVDGEGRGGEGWGGVGRGWGGEGWGGGGEGRGGEGVGRGEEGQRKRCTIQDVHTYICVCVCVCVHVCVCVYSPRGGSVLEYSSTQTTR